MANGTLQDNGRVDWDEATTMMTLPTGHRRLAAIVFADMVRYTELMHEDEQNAYEARTRYRKQLEKNVARYGGEIVQHYGDGALLLFHSAIDATRAQQWVGQSLMQVGERQVGVGLVHRIRASGNAQG